jgi:hypothetical protein
MSLPQGSSIPRMFQPIGIQKRRRRRLPRIFHVGGEDDQLRCVSQEETIDETRLGGGFRSGPDRIVQCDVLTGGLPPSPMQPNPSVPHSADGSLDGSHSEPELTPPTQVVALEVTTLPAKGTEDDARG